MLKKIYQEMVAIRKELQAINKNLESSQKDNAYVMVREPYGRRYKLLRVGRDESFPEYAMDYLFASDGSTRKAV